MSLDAPAEARSPRRWLLVVAGILIGGYSTLCGIGGGIFAVPLLHYVHRMPLRTAVANSLVLVAASTASGTLLEALHAESALRFDVIAALVAGSLVGSLLGFALSKRVPTVALKAVFALVLVATAAQLLLDDGARDVFLPGDPRCGTDSPGALPIAAIGFAAGVVAPLLGIGGGLVAVPGLLYLAPDLGFLVARASSVAMSTVTAWQSVWLYRRDGEIKSGAALWLAGGAVVGAAVGVQLVHVESVTRAARVLVALALLVAAARFVWDLAVTPRRGTRTS